MVKELLKKCVQQDASDIFLVGGCIPRIRRATQVMSLEGCAGVDPVAIDKFRNEILTGRSRDIYSEKGSIDSGFDLDEKTRFRINFFQERQGPALAARFIKPAAFLDFKSLRLPDKIRELSECPRGLILICGAASSGKSTTAAAMINNINCKYRKHVVLLEDPVEYRHKSEKSLITQREINSDSSGFDEALKNVVRESPDVIVIGEMRDPATMQAALSAAMTGHLVISTVHTANAVQSIERIINSFPEHLRPQVASDLALALKGVISQRLVPEKDDNSMTAVVELMLGTPLVGKLVAKRNFSALEEIMRQSEESGMIDFNRACFELFKQNVISLETGYSASDSPEEFMLLAQGMESGISTFRGRFSADSPSRDITMQNLLETAIENGVSDLLISAGSKPCMRLDGEVIAVDCPELNASDTQRLLLSIVNQRQRTLFEQEKELDFALTTTLKTGDEEKKYRFRVNAFYQRGNISIAIRLISDRIPSPQELGLPPALVEISSRKYGLILITGPTGHGKSTTLASLINEINENNPCHIITIEDPIEYVHENKTALVEQREVHADTLSFSSALKYVLRQDPDVILVGEMRDTETISAALTAAETGHLVLATLHTNNAAQSVDRIVDSFPAHQQNQIKLQLSGTLLAIAAQRLIPRKDGNGRVAAFELMLGNTGVRALIREGKTSQLPTAIETGFKIGMSSMDRSLNDLYSKGIISREEFKKLATKE